jgi:hypothetical protein
MKTLTTSSSHSLIRLGILATFLLSLFLLALPAAPLHAQETGIVTGTVTNGTSGEPLADAEVTLTKFTDQTGQNSEDITTTTASDGTFRFDGLDTSDGLAYAVSTRYLGVLYGSSAMILISDVAEQTADIVVFDTTTDQRRLSIATRAMIVTGVDRETGVISLTDAYTMQLAGDLTLIEGPDGYSVRFPVPENVAGITPRRGFDFGNPRIEESSVLVTTAVRPGETNVGLDYTFNYTGSSIDIDVTAGYPTDAFQILVPTTLEDAEILIEAVDSPLLDGGVVAISGRDYHVWSASSLAEGATFQFSLTGLPSPPTANTLNTVVPAILAGLALAAATAVTGWIIVSRGLHKPRPVVLAPAAAAPLDVRRELLSTELRELQAQWDAGELDEQTYQTSRRRILEDLRSISRQYRGLGDDE